jgi:hypothetical protein
MSSCATRSKGGRSRQTKNPRQATACLLWKAKEVETGATLEISSRKKPTVLLEVEVEVDSRNVEVDSRKKE